MNRVGGDGFISPQFFWWPSSFLPASCCGATIRTLSSLCQLRMFDLFGPTCKVSFIFMQGRRRMLTKHMKDEQQSWLPIKLSTRMFKQPVSWTHAPVLCHVFHVYFVLLASCERGNYRFLSTMLTWQMRNYESARFGCLVISSSWGLFTRLHRFSKMLMCFSALASFKPPT